MEHRRRQGPRKRLGRQPGQPSIGPQGDEGLQYGAEAGLAVAAMKVEVVRALMEHTNHSIDVVAQQTGFGDRNRMRRGFLRAYGQPPR